MPHTAELNAGEAVRDHGEGGGAALTRDALHAACTREARNIRMGVGELKKGTNIHARAMPSTGGGGIGS